jgi:hypothetical protein
MNQIFALVETYKYIDKEKQSMVSKHILFYSNFCQYSKEVLGIATKRNLNDLFLFVSVDNVTLKLPNFVQSVPTIYTTEKDVLVDNEVFEFVNKLQLAGDVEPFALFCAPNSISDTFSFIEGSIEQPTDGHNELLGGGRSFVYINDSEHSIITPKEADGDSKFDQKSFESYMAQRDNAIQMPQKRL